MENKRKFIKLDEGVKNLMSIPPNAKILHAEICALSQNEGYCFASNKHFAKEFGLCIQSVSRLLSVLKQHGLIAISYVIDNNGYRKRIIKPNSSMVLSKISVGNAQKREKPTLKNANHNIVRRIDKNNISYESNYGIDWGEDN